MGPPLQVDYYRTQSGRLFLSLDEGDTVVSPEGRHMPFDPKVLTPVEDGGLGQLSSLQLRAYVRELRFQRVAREEQGPEEEDDGLGKLGELIDRINNRPRNRF